MITIYINDKCKIEHIFGVAKVRDIKRYGLIEASIRNDSKCKIN